MWEWRIFVAASDISFVPDLWELVPSRPWSFRPEKRSDVYVAYSVLSGVKLRSKRTLEVKLRSERHSSGAERWDKVLHASLINWDRKSSQSLTTAIVDKLTACRDSWALSCSPTPERKQAVHDTLALSSSPLSTTSLFTLNKQRVSHHTQNVALEQTDIIVEGFESVKWRTIAIEGDLEKVLFFLKSELKVNTSTEQQQMVKLQDYLVELSGEPCGYPEFILKLKAAS